MTLATLREQLTNVDNAIIDLMEQRHAIAAEIGAVKRQTGQQTRDFRREKQVIENVRARAEKKGLSADLAQGVFERIIRSSLARQERDKVQAEGQGTGKTALVIGGLGKIGGWFVEFMSSQGFQVSIADPGVRWESASRKRDWQKFALEQDIIVIAAPLGQSASVLDGLADRRPAGLIFDVASLKTPVAGALARLRQAGCKVTSVHPMFGPDTDLLAGRHVLFLDAGHAGATAEARALFRHTMATQVEMPLADHDRLVGYVLGLSHLLNIAFFTVLAKSGEEAVRLRKISSTSFGAQLAVAKRISHENPHLYYEIQKLNECGDVPRQRLKDVLAELCDIIDRGDEPAFVRVMEEGEAYLKSIPSDS